MPSRREFLATSGLAVAGGGASGLFGPSTQPRHASSEPLAEAPARFAVLTDTHQNADIPERVDMLARVMDHIAARDPHFVLNCGDITDYGVDEDFATYRSTIPTALTDRVHHVPGNHETQWNADAWEAYRKHFGPTRHSFDAAGLHLVGMDPLWPQQWEPWAFTDELLDFLREDLAAVPPEVPIVVFNHFPLNAGYPFVNNRDDFWDVVEPYRVRVAFAGHTHGLKLWTYNGITQLVGRPAKDLPLYYWAERETGDDGDLLAITEVRVPEDGPATEQLIARAPLDEHGPGADLPPLAISATPEEGSVAVEVTTQPSATKIEVRARRHPQGTPEADVPWNDLSPQGTHWSGSLHSPEFTPGPHRIQVRVDTGKEIVWEGMHEIEVPTTGPSIGWTHALGEPVVGDLACDGSTVLVATITGTLTALDVTARGARRRWTKRLGDLYRGPVLAPDGQLAVVGSADHQLTALDWTRHGATRWQHDLQAPVMSEVTITGDGDDARILAAAGTSLWCFDLAGTVQWRSDLNGTFIGRAAVVDDRVFAGSSDGDLHAYDLDSGEELWSTSCTDSTSTYHRTIYGPQQAKLAVLDDGGVLVPCHTDLLVIEQASGAVRWSRDDFARVGATAPIVTERGVWVVHGKFGTIHQIDLATGADLWIDDTLPTSWGSSPIPTSDPDHWWFPSHTGRLVRLDLTGPSVTPVLQVATAYSTSTAVLTDGESPVLVSADVTGVVRGVVGLEA